MRVPHTRGFEALRRVVRLHLDTYTVTRPNSEQSGRFGESDTAATTHDIDLWVYDPMETTVDTEYGDRVTGDLAALGLPSVDIEVNDEIDHGGETYTVDDVVHLPDEDDEQLTRCTLLRVTNDGS